LTRQAVVLFDILLYYEHNMSSRDSCLWDWVKPHPT